MECFHAQLYLDEGVSSAVVRDGEAQRILGLVHLHLLFDALHMSEDEVLQTYLASEQLLHVDFVCVQGAKQDLWQEKKSQYDISRFQKKLLKE